MEGVSTVPRFWCLRILGYGILLPLLPKVDMEATLVLSQSLWTLVPKQSHTNVLGLALFVPPFVRIEMVHEIECTLPTVEGLEN